MHDDVRWVRSIVEKPGRRTRPSNLAVIGRYVFTPEIFDALDRIEPGVGGELQLTDAIGLLTRDADGVRPRVHRRAATTSGRRSTSSAPTSSSRSTAPTSAPRLEAFLARHPAPPRARLVPARVAVGAAGVRSRTSGARSSPRSRPSRAGRVAGSRRPRARARGRRRDRRSRSRRSRTPRWTATRCAPPTPPGAGAGAGVRLRVVGDLPAGHAPTIPVGPGEAIRIMTGAPIPDGADAIVMVERTERDGDDGVRSSSTRPRAGDHVRAAGGDLDEGDARVRRRARSCGPAHLGRAVRRSALTEIPRLPTGTRRGDLDRRRAVEEGPLDRPGRSATRTGRCCSRSLRDAGVEPVDLGIARDDEARIVATLEDAFTRCDAVITSGGVSVGDYDVVKAVLDRFGALEWWQVAIKPAKPLAFGVVRRHPGVRPARQPGESSLVSFELFARPALLADDGSPAAVPSRGQGPGRARLPAAARRQAPPRPRPRDVERRGLPRGVAAARRRATCCRPSRPPTASRCSPTATASRPATPSPSCSSTPPPTTEPITNALDAATPEPAKGSHGGAAANARGRCRSGRAEPTIETSRAVAGNSHSRPLPCLPPPAVRMLRPAPRRPELECGG